MNIARKPIDHISRGLAGTPSLFVCSTSFEERCLSIPRALAKFGIPHTTVVISFNEDYEEEAKNNLEQLREIFPGATDCRLRTDNPIRTMDNLIHALDSAWGSKEEGPIFVDITTFTRESLLMLLRLLMAQYRRW